MFKPLYLVRIFFILIATYCGYMIGLQKAPHQGLDYSILSFSFAVFIVLFEYSTNIISSKMILLAALGLFFGLVLAFLVANTIPPRIMDERNARVISNVIFGYFGIVLALKHADRFTLQNLKFIISNPAEDSHILDTSVIIDGRIADLLKINFITGPVIVPEFVLDELQNIADSTDHKRRARGRRALELLESLKESFRQLQVYEKDYPNIKDVDHKLIQLAKEINGDILTNDYNLNKVANLHQVRVLNINELANALKPTVFVGDRFFIHLIREGKEPNQGVGYLEDGTMVVVDDGRSRLHTDVEIMVSGILQTGTGRMVFGKLRENNAPQEHERDRERRKEKVPSSSSR